MSILDKHPAPWRLSPNSDHIVNSACIDGDECFHENTVVFVTCNEQLAFESEEAARLILATPELLAALASITRLVTHQILPVIVDKGLTSLVRIEDELVRASEILSHLGVEP